MSEPIHTETVNGAKIQIFHDCSPESPRDWDTLGTMVCWHSRYRLGEEHTLDSPDDFFDSIIEYATHTDHPDAAMREWVASNSEPEKVANLAAVILPLYLFDHSGLAMNTSGFHCPWDSGQVGYIYAMNDKIRKEYSVEAITDDVKKRAEDAMRREIEVYSAYLSGAVYGYVVKRDDEEIDSCWGYFGDYENECLSDARASAEPKPQSVGDAPGHSNITGKAA